MLKYPEVVVGTYEEFLLGYVLKSKENNEVEFSLDLASHAHQASIRCIASHGSLLASSGADEYINIYSMVSKKEIVTLTPHEGTVTCLTFTPDGSHLISGSQDGNIAIIRCSDWKVMKMWKEAHKGANGVTWLDVHPSGKLLMSVGADHVLRAWNLIKGRQAYANNFFKKLSTGNILNQVTWSRDGSYYAVAFGNTAEFYSVDKAAVVYSVKCAPKITCVDFSESGIAVTSREDGIISFHDIASRKQIVEVNAHSKRVKCVKFYKISKKKEIIVTADSQGIIKMWRWLAHNTLKLKAEVNADCRIVCLTLLAAEHCVKMEDDAVDESEVSKISDASIVEINDEKLLKANGTKKTKESLPKTPKLSVTVECEPENSKSKKRKRKTTSNSLNASIVSQDNVVSCKNSIKRHSTSKWDVT